MTEHDGLAVGDHLLRSVVGLVVFRLHTRGFGFTVRTSGIRM